MDLNQFIQKLWTLNQFILNKSSNKKNKENDQSINIFTNTIIEKVTKNLENFHYNIIIANLYEIYNFFNEKVKLDLDKENLLSNYIKILKIMNPIIPHFSNECLEMMNYKDKIIWPEVNKKFLLKNEFMVVIQINGKKKDLIKIDKEIDEEELLEKIYSNEKMIKLLGKSKIKKTIFIKNKLINLII